ncbi:uncharacterized protein DMAD_00801 [Drosophila madeirensis]|uniref:Secreted protein n=1 Tax=Drosophila madeirensis TaxID=30013 RepID=A0AAU9FZC8_DROMD
MGNSFTMQFRWIISVAVLASLLSRLECKTPTSIADFDDPAMLQRWNRALQAINDAERQRQQDKAQPNPVPVVRQQRPNDKHLRWRSNSKQLRLHPRRSFAGQSARAAATYTSTINVNAPNPTYLDVKDYVPSEPPWWFN